MSIGAGDKLPEATFKHMTEDGIQDISTHELCNGKTVVLFAVPGAFTPTCQDVHLPTYIDNVDQLKAAGADTVACVAVNDVFVMNEWRQARGIPAGILLLSDGNGEFIQAMGLELDASGFGMGIRSQRWAAVIKDGVVQTLNVEPGRDVGVSGAPAMLEALS
ncbi:MAG: peroxiredoxin [Acidobacteriota bacterium]